jgi:CBS domain-containing protein
MLVRDVMGPSMGGADANETLRDAWTRLEALDLDPLPVVEGDRVVGVLRRKQIHERLAASGLVASRESVHDVMAPATGLPVTDEDVEDVLKRLGQTEEASDRLPVLDRDGRLVGIVTVRALRQRDPDADDGVAAVQSVESIDSLVSYDDDPVDYEIDGSFPASDPPSGSSAGVTGPTKPANKT